MSNLFRARDPFSSYSHFAGAVLSVAGLVVMIVHCASKGSATGSIVAGILFCLSMLALYFASGLYHYVRCSDKQLLTFRKLDHAMIYVLIAGTYTPVMLHIIPGVNGVIFTSAIWAAALVGILIKMFWMGAPRWLSTLLYLLMGWSIIIDISAITALPEAAIWLLAGGGLCYTAGALIYMFKFPNFSKGFGFHEIFHVFVILGSICHYFMVLLFTI